MRMRYLPVAMAALLCGCVGANEQNVPTFPQTRWNMDAAAVMEAYDLEPASVKQYDAGRGRTLVLSGKEAFGARAETITFLFINLKQGESGDFPAFSESDQAALNHQEVLASVLVQYPKETDWETIVSELDARYGKAAVEEVTLFPLFSALDANMAVQQVEASDGCKVWGSEPIEEWLEGKDAAYFEENWKKYRPDLASEEDWDRLCREGRMVTIVCEENQGATSVRFDAYDLAVYNELKAATGEG